MTAFSTPVSVTLEMQRQAIEGSQQAIEQTIESQQRANAMLLDSIGSTEDAQQQGFDLTRSVMHSYLDAFEASVPGTDEAVAEIRQTVDEQFDQLEANHTEAFETVEAELESGVDASNDVLAEQLEVLTEQLDLLAEAHADVEGQTLEAVEGAEAQFEDLQKQLDEQGEEISEQVQAQFEQFQRQLEQLQAQVDQPASNA